MRVRKKKKIGCRILAAALSVCMLLAVQPDLYGGVVAQAAEVVESGTCGDTLTWTLDADGVLTIRGTGAMKDYSNSWTSTNKSPFHANQAIKTVVIEEGVTGIGKAAFMGCESLTAVTMPDSVTSIGDDAFYNCSALENVVMSKNVTSIGNVAFLACKKLRSIEIPDGVEQIGSRTFSQCESLTAVIIPDSVAGIGDGAFFHCSGLGTVTFQGTATIPALNKQSMDIFMDCLFVQENKKGIRIPHGYESSYLATEGWSDYASYIAHSHDDGVIFDQVLPASGGKLEGGNYYLTEDVALENWIRISSGAEVNLCLNGHTLYGPGGNSAIDIDGTLNVYDCNGGGVLSGDSEAGARNTAVTVETDGVLNLYSGKITGSGLAVIDMNGTANLAGGKIEGGSTHMIDNVGTVTIGGSAVVGGGTGSASCAVINNDAKSVLTVRDNASLSGLLYGVDNLSGTVNIEGGAITSTERYSYGIRNSGVLNITGGTVTGGGYGIQMDHSDAVLNLSGSPSVSGKTADLYLRTGTGVTRDNALDAVGYTGAALTVTEAATTGREDSYAIKTAEGNKDKFTLTDSGWKYLYRDGGLVLFDTANHTHSYTYAADGAVITESCICGHEETAALSVKSGADLTYTGSEIRPVTVTCSGGWAGTGADQPDESKITYTGNTDAGTATAALTVSGKTAGLDFTISPRGMDGAAVTLADGTLTYNGREQTKEVSGVAVNGKTLVQGTDYTISGNKGTDAGTYTLTVTGKGNYRGTASVSFAIAGRSLADGMVSIAPGPYYHTGNAVTPAVTVKDGSTVLASGADYTVRYQDNTSAGTATVTVTGKGNYTGTIRKTFDITVRKTGEDKPGVSDKPEVSRKEQEKNALLLNAKLKVSQPGKKINVVWGKVSGADGYDVYVQYCSKKFTKKSITAIRSGRTTKVTVKKVNGKPLDLKKNYKVYVLAYRLADGKKIMLAKTVTAHIVGRKNKKYTNVKAVKVKKNSYSLKKGKTVTVKARTVLVSPGKKQLTNVHAKQFRYASTDKKVAAVSAKGKIRAVGKGSCIIYVYARNGYAKKIKVKVK